MLFHNSPTCLWILSLCSTSTVLLPLLSIPRNPQFFLMNLAHSSPLLPLLPTSLCSLAISMFMSTLLLTHFPLPSLTSSHQSTQSNMSTSQLILRITPLTLSSHPLHLSFLLRYHALLSTSLIITSSRLTSKLNPSTHSFLLTGSIDRPAFIKNILDS